MIADEQLFRRVQQQNQRQIFDKLLHDLRNPVHALRITVELFNRVAGRKGDIETLLDRAGRYVAPAGAAMEALVAVTDRIAAYVSGPATPSIRTLRAEEILTEIAVLLRGAARGLTVDLAPFTDAIELAADRPRLGHALIRHCLSNAGTRVSLSTRADAGQIWIDVDSDPATVDDAPAFSADDLRVLIGNAGGTVSVADARRVSVGFSKVASS